MPLVPQELIILGLTAATVALIHTLTGPDHYLPFIVIAKARKWRIYKTAWVTFLCGLGHIGSSVILGLLGVAFGVALSRLKGLESLRGNIAGWAMIAFGFIYLIWGIRRAIKNKPHTHTHIHTDNAEHVHTHSHNDDHVHIHDNPEKINLTPWILFTIFVFGPCEPLIPLVMYPASQKSTFGLIWVVAIFGIITIATMLGIVLLASFGTNLLPTKKLERFSHALAGATILLCGVAIQFLGL